jgi:phage regulator Rha-like protein
MIKMLVPLTKRVLKMKQLINNKTMSSREIAILTEKEHRHVLRDIRIMLDQLELGVPSFEHTYFDIQNKTQTEYLLPEDLTMTLVSGYSVVLRHKIVKRWKELESLSVSPAVAIPQTLSEALRLAADLNDQLLAVNNTLSDTVPILESYVHFFDSENCISITDLAKTMNMTGAALNKELRERNIIYKNKNLPRVGFEDWFKIVKVESNGRYFQQMKVNPQGQHQILQMMH